MPRLAKPDKRVDFFFVEQAVPGLRYADPTVPLDSPLIDSLLQGTRTGCECTACGDRFFDQVDSKGRILISAVEKAIAHARRYHNASGGVVGGRIKS